MKSDYSFPASSTHFPEVGIATLELRERFGLDVAYPPDQTCSGQSQGATPASKPTPQARKR